jgi:ubiquinone/menaquinone biosynthesis C-methylase UbiE
MSILIVNPDNNSPLRREGDQLSDAEGNTFPIINDVPRITALENYAENFGVQWNKFDKTQLDRQEDGLSLSQKRFFAETGWSHQDLDGKDILEVGSGAGRFSRVVLEQTAANLYSIDYSDAVSANFKNNGKIASDRFNLFQASVYEMPFLDNVFDKVFCLGVLQHTPDFQASVKALISKAKPGGEVVVDFYPIKGWWTKLHAKYIFRPLTKRISHESLYKLIDSNVDWLTKFSAALNKFGLVAMTRFLPIVDLRTMPRDILSPAQLREWIVLDTFDMFSPEYDHPQKVNDVAAIFKSNGANVTFAGFVEYANGFEAAVVRGVKQ